MRAGSPWNATRPGASSSQRWRSTSSGKSAASSRSIASMSAGSPESAAHRNGPMPRQKSGRMYAGTNPGYENASREAGLAGLAAQVVPVVEDVAARAGELGHRPDVRDDRLAREADVALRVARAQRLGLLERHLGRHVPGERVVRRGLVGDEVEVLAPCDELGEHRGSVAEQPDRQRAPSAAAPRTLASPSSSESATSSRYRVSSRR